MENHCERVMKCRTIFILFNNDYMLYLRPEVISINTWDWYLMIIWTKYNKISRFILTFPWVYEVITRLTMWNQSPALMSSKLVSVNNKCHKQLDTEDLNCCCAIITWLVLKNSWWKSVFAVLSDSIVIRCIWLNRIFLYVPRYFYYT